jgi:chromosome segregation ATPase
MTTHPTDFYHYRLSPFSHEEHIHTYVVFFWLNSIRSFMCTLGSSSIFVCWERCSAASHAPRSRSLRGNIVCWVQQRMTEPGNIVSYNGTDYRRPPGTVVFGIGHESTNEERWGFACTRRDDLVTAVNAVIEERHTLRIEQGNVDNDYNLVKAGVSRDKFNKNDIAHCKQDFDRLVSEGRTLFNKLQEIVREINARKKNLAGEILDDIITAAETEGGENALKSAATRAVADTQVAAPANVAEAAVTPPAADTQGAAASALQTIAAAASAPAAAVTGDIAALTEALKKVTEELDVEKRKHEALRIVCQEHENTIKGLKFDPEDRKVLLNRFKEDTATLEKDRDKYRTLCNRIEGIMKDHFDPSSTQDIADVVKTMMEGMEQLKKDSNNLKTFTIQIGDILTPARLDSEGKSRIQAIQKLVAFQDGVVSKLTCGTVEKVDEFLDQLIRNELELNALQATESKLVDKVGVSSLEDIEKHIEELESDLTAARETISVVRGHAKLLTDIRKELGIEGQPTDEEIMCAFNNLKKCAEETKYELQADKLENMKNKATEWRAAVDSLHTENANLKASIADFTASSDASELDTIKQAKLNAETELAGVQSQLSTCKTELSTCKDNLHKCEQELTLIKPELERYKKNLNSERESYARLHDAHEILKGERTSSAPSIGSRTTTSELNERVSRLLDKLLRLAPSLNSDEIDVDTKVRKIVDAIMSTFNRGDQERAKIEVLKMLIQHLNLSDRSRQSLTESISRDLHALRGV